MIRINLLPDEFRRSESTPLPRMITIIAGVGLIFSLVLVNGWIFTRNVPEAETRRDETKDMLTLRKQTVEASGYEQLLASIKNLGLRKKAISDIYRSRVPWAAKIDQLVDLTPEYIGFVQLKLTEPARLRGSRNRNEMHGGILTMDCVSRETDLAQYSSFVAMLQGSAVEKPIGGTQTTVVSTTLTRAVKPADSFTGSTAFFKDFSQLKDRGWQVYEK